MGNWGDVFMLWRNAIVPLLLIGYSATMSARAEGITTYGTGLEACGVYLDARDQQSAYEMNFVDWFSGYLSGVNSSYNRANNVLADSNLKQALYWVENYCRAHTTDSFAVASFTLLRAASATTRTQENKPI